MIQLLFDSFDACLVAMTSGLCWLEAIAISMTCVPMLAPMMIRCFCCGACQIYTTSFASDDLATAWTIESGSWAITGGNLETTDASAVIINNTSVTGDIGNVYARVDLSGTGIIYMLYGAWTDANNHLYARLEYNAGNIDWELFEVAGGVSTSLASGFRSSGQLYWRLCWNGVTASLSSGNLGSVGSAAFVTPPTITTGPMGGVGAEVSSGTAQFQDFVIGERTITNNNYAGTAGQLCPVCNPCHSFCGSDTQTTQVQLDITGVTNGFCATCSNLNTTFILDVSKPPTSKYGCVYQSDSTNIDMGGFCGVYSFVYQYAWSNTSNVLTGISLVGGIYNLASSSGQDCGSTQVLSQTSAGTGACTLPSTMTVTPI